MSEARTTRLRKVESEGLLRIDGDVSWAGDMLRVSRAIYGEGAPHNERETAMARAVLALFEAAVPRIKAEALREAAASMDGTPLQVAWVNSGHRAADALRSRADRIEAGL